MIAAQRALRKFASLRKAKGASWFFKTGPGQYGEGDRFIGVTNPEAHSVAAQFATASKGDIKKLLKSPFHEDRLLGLMILVKQFKKAKSLKDKHMIVRFYLQLRPGINNWDLVDLSAYKILGEYCHLVDNDRLLKQLSKSKRHWDKRIAMVGTFAYIRKGHTKLTYEFAHQFLDESEDLMHKATGWMLREAGKRDAKSLRLFIKKHGSKMPRTMLRYSIEKFGVAERKKILLSTKVK